MNFIKKGEGWSNKYEILYQQFIHNLGTARKKGVCKTTNACLKNQSSNPLYYNLNPKGLGFIFSDCAEQRRIFATADMEMLLFQSIPSPTMKTLTMFFKKFQILFQPLPLELMLQEMIWEISSVTLTQWILILRPLFQEPC